MQALGQSDSCVQTRTCPRYGEELRPEHAPTADPCSKCGLAASRHRRRRRLRGAYFEAYNRDHGSRSGDHVRRIIAIDGEGYTTKKGAHRYTYLAACDEDGLVDELRNDVGLRADQVFAWLCGLPAGALLVGFSLGYDRTKWVESWPDAPIWRLMHPEDRRGESGPLPVEWGGYKVNLVSSRMTVRSLETGAHRTIWDVFKFYQSSFVKALTRWNIGTQAERDHIAKEKKRRGRFSGIRKEERVYCQTECRLLARLVRALIDAHEAEGLRLQSYFGPGSTASVILRELKADEHNARVPGPMKLGVMCAYFGGRFECSRVGPVCRQRLYAYDLASAYPAAMVQLPCIQHARWVRVNNAAAEWCLVRYRIEPHKDACPAWGPLPHRLPDGNIVFPVQSAGGWAWGHEFRAAQKLHPGVKCLEAWQLVRECACGQPFAKRIRELYERRVAWGSSTAGIVLKLALNSLYGKSAQRVGKGRFRCMVRAGLITSLTRARLLEAILAAKDPWDILELATDSVLSTRALPIEAPGLGGWTRKPWHGGVFLMRPGLRFALDGDDEKSTAARGVGTRTLHKNRARVLRQWEREPMTPVTLATPSFFHGAKLEVRRTLAEDVSDDERAYLYTRGEYYGRWTDETRTLRYTPTPKRELVTPDFRLTPWALPMGAGCESMPYGSVDQSELADALDSLRELEEDQPDAGGLALL